MLPCRFICSGFCLADGRTIEAPYPRHFLHLLRRLNLQDALSA